MNKIIASKDIFQIFPNLISSNVHVLSSLSWWCFLKHFQFLVVQNGPSRWAPGLGLHHSVAWLEISFQVLIMVEF